MSGAPDRDPARHDPRIRPVADRFAVREIQVFMPSNQLPLLEARREGQEVTGQAAAYRGAGTPKAAGRFFGRTEIIAFGDPNDLMSYPVPDRFAERYSESRLCPQVINVAGVNSLLGLGEVANPLSTHTGHDANGRVGIMIAKGAGHPGVAPIVAERCTWRETERA
ncbi:MAG TPA: hypothetical protein VFY87_12130 [Geminicoccaceae bacterium]|nr:hypothetical protein [Geminicoccaceae bacterium]